jgi:hypothetical protein
MNIDFTPEELAQITKLCEAAGMSDPRNNTIHAKVMRCLQNFPPADYDADPQAAAEKWQRK